MVRQGDRARSAAGGLWGEILSCAVLGDQALDGALTHAKQLGHLALTQPTLDSGHDAVSQVQGIGFHGLEHTTQRSFILTTAVRG